MTEESLNTMKKWKAVYIPENDTAIVPDINYHVVARYDRKAYVGKVFQIDDSDAKLSFWDFINRFNFLRAQKEG